MLSHLCQPVYGSHGEYWSRRVSHPLYQDRKQAEAGTAASKSNVAGDFRT
jgi:hypothetical protein